MIAVNYSTIRDHLKAYCDKVSDENETVIVTRKGEKNVVIISLDEWNDMMCVIKDSEYRRKIDRGFEQIRRGQIVTKTLEELETMENE